MAWHETCGVTNLPILRGDKVTLYPLILNPRYGQGWCAAGHTYVTEYWSPSGPPIHGIYDDYGGLENVQSGMGLDFLLDRLRSESDEQQQTEYDCPDLTVSRDDFIQGAEGFGHAMHLMRSDRLSLGGRLMGMVMMHEHVHDALLPPPLTDGEWLVLEDEISRVLDKAHEREYVYVHHIKLEREHPMFGLEFSDRMHWVPFLNACISSDKPNREGLALLARCMGVSRHMENLRRTWLPQSGKGSSTWDAALHLQVAMLTSAWCQEAITRRKEQDV